MNDMLKKLEDMGASGFNHVDGNLMDHLMGTRTILDSWNARKSLLDAGLFHASYSTSGFNHQLVSADQRNVLIELIGAEAEEIVYQFCACDRKVFYPRIGSSANPRFANRFTGQEYRLESSLLNDFCELAVANEIDIAEGNPGFMAKHGAARYTTYSSMTPYLSEQARAAVEQVFCDHVHE